MVEPVADAADDVKPPCCLPPDLDCCPTPGPGPTPEPPEPDQQVEVPDLRGQTLEDALNTLNGEDYDFQVTVEEVPGGVETVPGGSVADVVIGTDPRAGEWVEKGSPITVLVSTGPRMVGMAGTGARATGMAAMA